MKETGLGLGFSRGTGITLLKWGGELVLAASAVVGCNGPSPSKAEVKTPGTESNPILVNKERVLTLAPTPVVVPALVETVVVLPAEASDPLPTPMPTIEAPKIIVTATPEPVKTVGPQTGSTATPEPVPTRAPEPVPTRTPEPVPTAEPKKEYYTQTVSADGILIKGNSDVDPRALQRVREIVLDMTSVRPDIRAKLVQARVSVAIIPRNGFFTQIPEYAFLRSQKTPDGRSYDSLEGHGGSPQNPTTVTSEANVLQAVQPYPDGYRHQDATIHEVAHTIMDVGFSPEEASRWKAIYDQVKAGGKFSAYPYSMSNEKERWAVLTQVYFGVADNSGAPSLSELVGNDPEAHKFLQAVYGIKAK